MESLDNRVRGSIPCGRSKKLLAYSKKKVAKNFVCHVRHAYTAHPSVSSLAVTRETLKNFSWNLVVMLDIPRSEVVWRILATHYIRQFPLHLPSGASLCATTFQLDSTNLQGTETDQSFPYNDEFKTLWSMYPLTHTHRHGVCKHCGRTCL
jgi:hypothetical protein